MTGKWHGDPPTREQVLAEITRYLQTLRGVPSPNLAVIDRFQAAYDLVMEHWPR